MNGVAQHITALEQSQQNKVFQFGFFGLATQNASDIQCTPLPCLFTLQGTEIRSHITPSFNK